MVAKINVGSSLYGVLAYNQKKIDEMQGRVLFTNRMFESEDGNFNIHRCLECFEMQLPQDIRTEKPIIHISLNPHPDDKLNDVQLSEIAQEYMDKLGYGAQPYIVYKHEDINRHQLDCYNADNGILVNGLKQLVSIRTMSLVRGRNTHIRINVTDDFLGTASSDTKIDNVTIQGMSSNEDIYGIYIDGSCHDNKISDTFIYGTKYAVVTKSAGHFLNNVHILSLSSTGGTDLGYEDNFRDTEGIRIETGGFFIFNQVYYDTVDKAIVVTDNHAPILLLDQNVSFSYLDNFGSSFIYRDKSATSDMQVKLSNSVFTLKNRKVSYKIFDMNVPMIGWDVRETFTFVNCAIENPHLINPYDPCLLQRLRKTTSDAIIFTDISNFDTEWHVLGALVTSPYRNLLRLDFDDNFVLELDAKFTGTFDLIDYKILNSTIVR